MGIDENFWNELKQGDDFIADVGNSSDVQKYQVYLNGNWIADCDSFEQAKTIANGNAMNGSVDI
tara:strand:+ start:543 stop:734 length:192 start_codon:yes stop_codon:yes gene_type:complete